MTRSLRLSLVPAAVVVGVLAEWSVLHRGALEEAASAAEIRLAVGDFVVGVALVACGVVAWLWRSQSRIGPLLAATGFAWFLGTLAGSSIDSVAGVGAVFVTLHRGPLVHAVLSYPTGRLRCRLEWVVVALSYVAAASSDLGQNAEVALGVAALVPIAAAGSHVRSTGPQRRAAGPPAAGARPFARDGDEPLAALVHDAGVLQDSELVQSVAAAARIAVSNVRLQTKIRRQVEEIEASRRRIVEAADVERRRLESELQQGAERRLAQVETALLESVGNRDQSDLFDEALAELGRARSELQEFAQGIHPRVLTEGGLPAALADLARRATVPVEHSAPEERVSPSVEAAAYFVCSEALANIGKYAEATRATVEVERAGERLLVSVRDDGIGGASLEKGSGLRGLADRVEALGGRLEVESPPGRGTLLTAELPV